MFAVVCALAFVAVASAQGPPQPVPPCAAPTRWYGDRTAMDMFMAKNYKNDSDAFVHGAYAYDELIKAKRTIEFADEDGNLNGRFDILELDTKVYVVDQGTRECKVYDNTRGFRKHQIPVGARSVGIHYLGSPGDAVAVTQFIMDRSVMNNGVNTTVHDFLSFTQTDCVPVLARAFDEAALAYMEESFGDVTIGVPGTDIWDIPRECPQ